MSTKTDIVADASAHRLRRAAAARAMHPSGRSAGLSASDPAPEPVERHLAVAKPIRPPAAPEAWSAGLWGSFA